MDHRLRGEGFGGTDLIVRAVVFEMPSWRLRGWMRCFR